MERYNVYSAYLKGRYGEKVYKLPISIPDTCPNRDGTLGVKGCIYCGSIGAGYENLPASMTVEEQIQKNIAHIAPKYKAKKYIAYFQNFTNTYVEPRLFRQYLTAACQPDIVGIAIATRPDCRTCTHVILNLPWDDMADVIETAKIISALPVHEVKLHALYVIKGTVLADMYENGDIQLGTVEEYVDRVVTFLEYCRPDIVFQRLIGRAPKEATEFANWGMGWWKIRDMIDAELERRDTWQGKKCTYLHGKALHRFMDTQKKEIL